MRSASRSVRRNLTSECSWTPFQYSSTTPRRSNSPWMVASRSKRLMPLCETSFCAVLSRRPQACRRPLHPRPTRFFASRSLACSTLVAAFSAANSTSVMMRCAWATSSLCPAPPQRSRLAASTKAVRRPERSPSAVVAAHPPSALGCGMYLINQLALSIRIEPVRKLHKPLVQRHPAIRSAIEGLRGTAARLAMCSCLTFPSTRRLD